MHRRSQLDPDELDDLGQVAVLEDVRKRLFSAIFHWMGALKNRTTMPDERVATLTEVEKDEGILIGFWDEADLQRATRVP